MAQSSSQALPSVQTSPGNVPTINNSINNNPANTLSSTFHPNMHQNIHYGGLEAGPLYGPPTANTPTVPSAPQYAPGQLVNQPQQAPFNLKNVTRDQKDIEPWIYRGYHDFCKWISADNDFYVLRQFSQSSIRVALFMQNQIADLEDQLRTEDEWCMANRINNGTFQFDENSRRRDQILPQLAQCIQNYHQFIVNQRLLQQAGAATSSQIQNVRRWLEDAHQPLRDEEADFINKERDLIPILASDRTPLRRFLERFDFIRRLLPKQRKILEETFAPQDFEQETTHPSKGSHLEKFVFCTITLLGLGMLIGPLWWLNSLAVHGNDLAPRLGVITGFLVFFVILISLLTNARSFEVLAATAAYGAVLMVFMQLQRN